MGSRLLKDWIMHPLYDLEEINTRQNQIEYFVKDYILKDKLKDYLGNCYDIQRLVGRVSFGSANPQDIMRLRNTLNQLPTIMGLIDIDLFNPYNKINQLIELTNHLNEALNDEAPTTIKDGNVFKNGYNRELDELRDIQHSGKKWLLDFEAKEKERTQIKNLKIG